MYIHIYMYICIHIHIYSCVYLYILFIHILHIIYIYVQTRREGPPIQEVADSHLMWAANSYTYIYIYICLYIIYLYLPRLHWRKHR